MYYLIFVKKTTASLFLKLPVVNISMLQWFIASYELCLSEKFAIPHNFDKVVDY